MLLMAPPAAAAEPALEALLERLAADGQFSGAVVVMRNGQESSARAFGWADQAARRPFTADTPSDGASIAKPMTAAAVLMLAKSGAISLDAEVASLLHLYPHKGTTIRHLLAHSGGLPDYPSFQALLDAGSPVSTTDLLSEVANSRPAPIFEPGSRFEYCDLCYDTLGLLLETLTGQSYGEVVQDMILGPAGVRAAFARPARLADWPVPRTIGYASAKPGAKLNDQLDNEGFLGGSNMMVSAHDLAHFAQSWLTGPLAALRPLAVEPVEIAGQPSRIRLGNWSCNDQGSRCQYGGHHQGFDSLAGWDVRSGTAIALVSNGSLPPWTLHRLQRALLAAAENRPISMRKEPAACRTRADTARVAGRYAMEDRQVDVIATPDGLLLRQQGQPAAVLFAVSPGTFYAPGLDAYICFEGPRRLLWFSAEQDLSGKRIP